jgi:hypothetical protein
LEFVGAQAGEAGPLVVALDEFQWLWDAQPAIDSILQRRWGRWQRDAVPLTVVLSGSAVSRMEQLVEHGRPLYGRADYRPLLLPLDYRQAATFADTHADAQERLRRYAVRCGAAVARSLRTPYARPWLTRSCTATTVCRGPRS